MLFDALVKVMSDIHVADIICIARITFEIELVSKI